MSVSSHRVWRLVDSGFVPPDESVAIDEAILEAHISGEVPCTLHFYVRDRPTVSLGYFQKVAESVNLAECAGRGVAIVRRKSGGSSIYTDPGQLIYGLVVHEDDLPADRQASFEAVCSSIARAIASFGPEARYRPMNDVEVCGRKISGSAQLRRKGSVLQHGTVLVEADLAAMDAVLRLDSAKNPSLARPSDRVATLATLLGRAPVMGAVKSRLVAELAASFSARIEAGVLSPVEGEKVRVLCDQFYSRREWNEKF